jgi:hypothetical protein
MQTIQPEPVIEKTGGLPEKKVETFIEQLVSAGNGPFSSVFGQADSFNLQIVYTRIDRDKDNKPHFSEHFFQPGHPRYFYPASTVKMPVAILALQN